MKNAFFFDVDDTLCSTGPVHEYAFLESISQLGIDIPNFAYQDFVGLSTEEVFDRLVEDSNLAKTATKLKRQIFQNSTHQIFPKSGAVEIMEFLSKTGKHISAVSSGSLGSVESTLNSTGMTDFIDNVITCELTTKTKPFPDPYLLAISQSGYLPNECMAIEDSEVGVRSAISAGIDTVLICNLPGTWVEKYPVVQFGSLLELMSYLKELR
jgi:HAD superfamily hydrolase (TIGR01509 family)